MVRDKAEKQKQKAKEMLGIDDSRAEEIFEEQPDRKQQKKKELEDEGVLEKEQQRQRQGGKQQAEGSTEEPEDEQEQHACPECGDKFDSEQGMKVHKGQKH